MQAKTTLFAMAMFAMCIAVWAVEWKPATKEDGKQLLNHLLPLPHAIAINEKVVLNPEDISVKLRKGAGDVEKNGFSILTNLVNDRLGHVPSGNVFEIIVGVFDENGKLDGRPVENAEKLKALPNNDQAYLIQPIGRDTLIVTGNNEKGVYYGVRTLCQILTPVLNKDKIEMPLVKVEDWPDMAERGLWHGHGYEIAKELSALKINYVDYTIQPLPVKKSQKTGIAAISRHIVNDCYLNAINCVAMIYHLNFVLPPAYEQYPELAGKGDSALPAMNPRDRGTGAEHRCPCASEQDVLQNILAGWFEGMAAGGAREMTVWTTEFYAQCACENCVREGQLFLEVKALLAAWTKAREKYPDARLRIVISMRTADAQMAKVLAEIPADVKIARICYIGHQRNDPRDLFVDPQFDRFAGKGAWVSCYELPPMRNLKFLALPYKDFIASLMQRGWHGGDIILNTEDAKFNWESNRWNINALAEWSWNNKGRDIKSFATAYATINRYPEPEKFAQWAEIMAPIEYDLYGSGEPLMHGYWFGEIKRAIASGKRAQCWELGDGFFRYFPAPESFGEKISSCEKALAIAQALNMPELILETRLNICAIQAAKTANQLMNCLDKEPVDKKGLNECVRTFERLAKERVDIFDARQKMFSAELLPAFLVESAKAGRAAAVDFPKYLKSELGALLQ